MRAQNKEFGAPPPLPPGAPLAEVLSNVQRILTIMVNSGYALKVVGGWGWWLWEGGGVMREGGR
jgi:hypothetical protein